MATFPQFWTCNGLEVELGIDRRVLSKKLAKCPVAKTEADRTYFYMADVIATLYGAATSTGKIDDERIRLVKAQADHEELKVSQLSGTLVLSDAVIATWQTLIANCRARLLSTPTKIAPLLANVPDVVKIEATLKEAIIEALDELNQGDGLPYDAKNTERGDGGMDSAADIDSEPVGGQGAPTQQRKQRRTGKMEH